MIRKYSGSCSSRRCGSASTRDEHSDNLLVFAARVRRSCSPLVFAARVRRVVAAPPPLATNTRTVVVNSVSSVIV